jgi:hypothetical protein
VNNVAVAESAVVRLVEISPFQVVGVLAVREATMRAKHTSRRAAKLRLIVLMKRLKETQSLVTA